MSVYSIWPFFACMGILLVISAAPVFKQADIPPNPQRNRISTLDGLRGFLALSVFFHHAAIYHERLLNGSWALPPSDFYTLLGQVGVAMFFLITGYLFWDRIVRTYGRPDWLQLYVGRIFRIGPLYLLAAVVMLAIVFIQTGFHLNVPAIQLAEQLGRWLALGFVVGPDEVNGHPGSGIILTGTWTLRFEWRFYLCLPLIALAARSARMHLIFAAAGLALSLTYVVLYTEPSIGAPPSVCVTLFFAGMTCASLARQGIGVKLQDWVASTVVLALLATIFVSFSTANKTAPIILLGLAFYLIASGCTLFGLLTSRAALRLGDISYGVYLLQGLVFAAVFSFDQTRAFALASPSQHWVAVLVCAMLLVVVATVTHAAVERTGIDAGKRIAAALASRRKAESAVAVALVREVPPASVSTKRQSEPTPK